MIPEISNALYSSNRLKGVCYEFFHFDYLKQADHRLAACIRYCVKAKRYVRTNPGDTAIYARQALENLFLKQSRIHNIKPSNLSESIKQNCHLLKQDNELIRCRKEKLERITQILLKEKEITGERFKDLFYPE